MHLKCIISTKEIMHEPNFYHETVGTSPKKGFTEFPAVVLTGPRQSGKTTLFQPSQTWVRSATSQD
jgi:predicted AAA+ superfamily ATPase